MCRILLFFSPASPWVVGRREHDPYRRPPLHDAEWYPWGGGHLRVEVDPESVRQEHRCRHPCPASGVVATVEPEDGAAAAGMQEDEEEEEEALIMGRTRTVHGPLAIETLCFLPNVATDFLNAFHNDS